MGERKRGGEGREGKIVSARMETISVEQYCVMALNLEEFIGQFLVGFLPSCVALSLQVSGKTSHLQVIEGMGYRASVLGVG